MCAQCHRSTLTCTAVSEETRSLQLVQSRPPPFSGLLPSPLLSGPTPPQTSPIARPRTPVLPTACSAGSGRRPRALAGVGSACAGGGAAPPGARSAPRRGRPGPGREHGGSPAQPASPAPRVAAALPRAGKAADGPPFFSAGF